MELRIPTLEQLRTVYDRDLRTAFPAAELKPLKNMEEMWAEGRYRPSAHISSIFFRGFSSAAGNAVRRSRS